MNDGAQALAETLQPGGLTPWSSDGLTLFHRHRSTRGRLHAEALAADWAAKVLGPPPTTPYSHGQTRHARADTIARRDGVAVVLARWPDVTVGQISDTWRTGSADTPGGLLRTRLDRETDEYLSSSTLARDLQVLRQERNPNPSQ